MRRLIGLAPAMLALALGLPLEAGAGKQIYEPLSASVRSVLSEAVRDSTSPHLVFKSDQEGQAWLAAMSHRLAPRMPKRRDREEFLIAVQYEAKRAGLDPQMVLGLIQVESAFRKYAVSSAGARGYMQVMPFWVDLIGRPSDNLFHMRVNLRYGCLILRHYLDIERGDLFRALGRYNGSLGQAEYPRMVEAAWHNHWAYPQRTGGTVPAQRRHQDGGT